MKDDASNQIEKLAQVEERRKKIIFAKILRIVKENWLPELCNGSIGEILSST